MSSPPEWEAPNGFPDGVQFTSCDMTPSHLVYCSCSFCSVIIRNTVMRIQHCGDLSIPCSFCSAFTCDPDPIYMLDSPVPLLPDTLQGSTAPLNTPLCFTCMLELIAWYTFEQHPHTHHTIHLVHTPHPPAHPTHHIQDPSDTLLIRGKSVIEIKASQKGSSGSSSGFSLVAHTHHQQHQQQQLHSFATNISTSKTSVPVVYKEHDVMTSITNSNKNTSNTSKSPLFEFSQRSV